MRTLLLVLPVFLTGCAPMLAMLAPPYVPQPIHVYGQSAYAADLAECQAAGAAFKPQFSIGSAVVADPRD